MVAFQKRGNLQIIFRAHVIRVDSFFYSYNAWLFIKMDIQGFLKALISNLMLDLQIENGGSNMADRILKKFQLFGKSWYIRIFRVADYEFFVI